ncbi:MAG: hypothetical protein ROO76_19705 [Terriglobia bacterium]|nr:hypothetical protein [Terriglobia bacterium]
MNASSSDFSTIDAIIHAMYDVLSGPAGQPRDWERLRAIYHPGAHLTPVVSIEGQPARARLLSPEDYIRRVEPIFAVENFWERESRRECETFGRVAHVLSYYDSFRDPNGTPFESGVNSVQLFNDGVRWWILSVVWNTARSA